MCSLLALSFRLCQCIVCLYCHYVQSIQCYYETVWVLIHIYITSAQLSRFPRIILNKASGSQSAALDCVVLMLEAYSMSACSITTQNVSLLSHHSQQHWWRSGRRLQFDYAD